jgi:hypothetical protein
MNRMAHKVRVFRAFNRGFLGPMPEYIGYGYTHSCVRILDQVKRRSKRKGVIIYSRYAEHFADKGAGIGYLKEGTATNYYLKGIGLRRMHKPPTALSVLDTLHEPEHQRGVEWTLEAKKRGWPTVCVQHGGTKLSSMQDLIESSSEGLATWTRVATDHCRERTSKRVVEVGMPSAARLVNRGAEGFFLLGTCLHSEYKHNPAAYTAFLKDIEWALSKMEFNLIIAPHPIDKVDDYGCLLEHPGVRVKAESESIYELLSRCSAVITRASTLGEEGLICGKPVIFHDAEGESVRLDYQTLASDDYAYFTEGRSLLHRALEQAVGKGTRAARAVTEFNPDLIFDSTLEIR